MNPAVIQQNPDARRKILRLERALLDMPEYHFEPEIKHYFAPGLYAREMFLPKDTIATGKIHLTQHLNLVSRGHILVTTEEGVVEIDAREHPVTFVSPAGTKRAAHALEDTYWTAFHLTTETDVDKIESLVVTRSYDALEAPKEP